jgi:DNA-nicking Smr family endonuclease
MAKKSRIAGLSESDRALWHLVVRDAKPLKGRDLLATTVAVPAVLDSPPALTPAGARKRPVAVPAKPLAAPAKRSAPALTHGAIAGVDGRRAERLRRGKLPIEATLDLHGMTQAAAQGALDSFIARSQASGRRCVLVITGKGRTHEESGVLRRQVPLWLNLPLNRARVLAFDYAQPKHGGSGALYVLLRRLREDALHP